MAGLRLSLIVCLALASNACMQAGKPGYDNSESTSTTRTQAPSTSEPNELPPIYDPQRCAQGEPATVTKIVDGDTIDVQLSDGQIERVRYIGIDTPEIDEPCYAEASARNRVLLSNQAVLLIRDTSERDIYGRLLRYICTVDEQFVEAQLVAEGYAHAYRYYPDVRYADYFRELEAQAIGNARGCLHAQANADNDATGTQCCKVCRTGQACGNSCIPWSQACHAEVGCACQG